MKKRILGVVLAAVMGISTSLVAFANQDRVDAIGYGELWGSVEATDERGYYVVTGTAVDVNPGWAVLKANIEMLAPDGSCMHTDTATSASGETTFWYNFSVNNFEGVSAVYCSHEARDGGTGYPDAAVYTVTRDLPW